jgi:hypothetical protein
MRADPTPVDRTKFDAVMNAHFIAMRQCLCDLAIAVGEVTRNHAGMEAALNARINDPAIERPDLSVELLNAMWRAAQQHAERIRSSRT